MTITTIRPSGVLGGGTGQPTPVTTTGAANPTLAVSDNSDSSYIIDTATYSYIRFTLPAVTGISPNQRVKSCTARIRNCKDSTGSSPQVTKIQLMDNVTSAAAGSFQSSRSDTTPTTFTGPVAYSNPSGGSWLALVQAGNVTIQTQWLNNVRQRVHELYVDVDINTQPVVSGVTVTNFTNNASPTVSWTYFDADSDGQQKYRIKIFNATQVAAGNFSPDTSPADYDSGEISSANTTVDLSKSQTVFFDRFGNPYILPGAPPPALQNGVTYTAYVKASQYWPVPVDGADWWSAWSASSTFTITFTPPPTPVINSVNVLADQNQYRAMISTLVPVNLLTSDNASFEGSIGQWVAVSNCSITVTGVGADGTHAMKMTATAAGDMEAKCNFDLVGNPWVMGNELYNTLASFRAGTTGRSCQVGLEYIDIAGSTIATHFSGSITDTTSGYTQADLGENTPANARQAKVHVKVLATAAAGESHIVDKVDVHAGATTTWTPGGYNNNQGDLIVERLEYLNDNRGPADNWFHPQVASCGTLLQNQGYGFGWNTTQSDLNWKWLDKTIPAAGNTPAGMLDWRPSLATTSRLDFGNWIYGGTAYMVPVVQGQTHIFSVWAWVDTTTFSAQPFIQWYDQNGAFISNVSSSAVTLTTTPQLIFVTGTPPANAVLAAGAVLNFASDNGHHVYFTRAGFGLGTTPVDGKLAQGLPTGISSTGTPVGAQWRQVRFNQPELSGLAPGFAFGQVEQIPDYDYAPARPTLYRASITYSSGSQILKSPYSTQLVAYAAPPTATVLRSVTNPMLQFACLRRFVSTLWGRKAQEYTTITDSTVFHPLGADGAPVQVRDWVGGEDGDLSLITVNEAQAARLLALISSNDVMLIQWAQGGRTYCQITGRTYDEETNYFPYCDVEGQIVQPYMRYVMWTLTYVETVMP